MTTPALMPVYPRCGVRPVRGEGCYLYGEDGTEYLDFAAGIAAFNAQSSNTGVTAEYDSTNKGIKLTHSSGADSAASCGASGTTSSSPRSRRLARDSRWPCSR